MESFYNSYLFIPYFLSDFLKNSSLNNLIIPKYFVDLSGRGCNKMGVNWLGFEQQVLENYGYGCKRNLNFCLENQPFNFANRYCKSKSEICSISKSLYDFILEKNRFYIPFTRTFKARIIIPLDFGHLKSMKNSISYIFEQILIHHTNHSCHWTMSGSVKKLSTGKEKIKVWFMNRFYIRRVLFIIHE